MIKDGYDDYQRFVQDKFLNNKKTARIQKDGKPVEAPWMDIMTGNLLLIKKDEGNG
jgi:hypothetical protein